MRNAQWAHSGQWSTATAGSARQRTAARLQGVSLTEPSLRPLAPHRTSRCRVFEHSVTPCTCSLAHHAAVRAACRSVHTVYYHTNAPPQHCCWLTLPPCPHASAFIPLHRSAESGRHLLPRLRTAACTQLYIDGRDRRLACCRDCRPAVHPDGRRDVCAVHSTATCLQSAACLQSVPWPRVHPGCG